MAQVCIKTVEMHTGGEAVRIIVSGKCVLSYGLSKQLCWKNFTPADPVNSPSGYPPVPGDSILEQRRYAKEKLDHLRTMLMFEPRGHKEMYGALLVETTHPDADMAVLFMHNEGML